MSKQIEFLGTQDVRVPSLHLDAPEAVSWAVGETKELADEVAALFEGNPLFRLVENGATATSATASAPATTAGAPSSATSAVQGPSAPMVQPATAPVTPTQLGGSPVATVTTPADAAATTTSTAAASADPEVTHA